jgi:TPP-dependent pyruvate/acetoin dehydrogenase alpha subunit
MKDEKLLVEIYSIARKIREFENALEDMFSKGLLFGTIHGCRGQEIVPAIVSRFINLEKDFVTSTHRSHGHYLSLFSDCYPLVAELMGKADGLVQGIGGSQHLYRKGFLTNGITGGMIPTATGIAFGKKIKKNGGLVIAYLGDGGMNEGYVLESINFSSVYGLPILYLLENNNYAMSTPVNTVTKSGFTDRIKGFGVESKFLTASEPCKLIDEFPFVIDKIRNTNRPFFIEVETYRFSGHSKSDKGEYRNPKLHNFWIHHDPLEILGEKLDQEERKKIDQSVYEEVQVAILKAKESKDPVPEEVILGRPLNEIYTFNQ